MRILCFLAVVGLLASCASTGGPSGSQMTPSDRRATMVLPKACQRILPNGSGQACGLGTAEGVNLILFLDDLTVMFTPDDREALLRDNRGAETWDGILRADAEIDALNGIHNTRKVTSLSIVTIPAGKLPGGADACVRNDWAGTFDDFGSTKTFRSREYDCIKWFPQSDTYQMVGIEVVESRYYGQVAAPLNYRTTADRIFESIKFP